jgi:hypothetical protein
LFFFFFFFVSDRRLKGHRLALPSTFFFFFVYLTVHEAGKYKTVKFGFAGPKFRTGKPNFTVLHFTAS